jgi:adenylylsulfate kinase
MKSKIENIHPEYDKTLSKDEKERLLKQRGKVVWLTGLSGAGKTTIANLLELELYKRGFVTQILDGDIIRSGINNNLGFSVDAREENIRRVAEVSKLFVHCGIICLNSFISPTKEIREKAKQIIGENNFIEVFVNTSLAVCEQRDIKGLYKKAREGKIKNFTGIDSPYEKPENPDLILNSDQMTIEESVAKCIDFLIPIISYTEK